MWILSILPDWAFHALLIAGVLGTIAGFVLGMIPAVRSYLIPIRVISLIVLSLALFLEGGLADNQVWQLKVKEVEAKIAKAEAESAQANTKIVEKATTRIAKQKEKTVIVRQYIDREVTKYDSQCVIPKEFIKAHNDAAEQAK
jgi:uncharacterized membrane protein